MFYTHPPHKLFSTKPQIVINERGIANNRWREGFIPWEQIANIWLEYKKGPGHRIFRVPVILVLQKGTQKPVRLNLTGLDRNAEEVWSFMQNFEPAEKYIGKRKTAVSYQQRFTL